ncbi:MAG: hypothetical protein FJ146_03825 [Deltaproteobacteria bacterium]|nr:hypothetical protein [Deltaproteobacteria bacterium]
MRFSNLLPLLITVICSPAAMADQMQGLVRVTGNPPFKQVTITKPREFSGVPLCPGDKAKRIMNLESLVVKIYGGEKTVGATKCFEMGSFTVLKTPAGNTAVVGQLQQKEGVFFLLADDGRTLPLSDVPDGLRSMIGKKVVLDIRPQNTLTGARYEAVYYLEFP